MSSPLFKVLLEDLEKGFIRLPHGFPDLPVHDKPAVSVKDAHQVIESASDIEVRDIDVPMLMGSGRSMKACAFSITLGVPFLEQACL
jgi:hypothetical protein